MQKIIIGVAGALILTIAFLVSPLSQTIVSGQSDNSSEPVETDNITINYREVMNSILQQVADEIGDSDNAEFYRLLIQGYNLDQPPSGTDPAGPTNPEEQFSDFQAINQRAITLPLEEAGKTIRDEDIAEFYDRFLERAGWTTVPD